MRKQYFIYFLGLGFLLVAFLHVWGNRIEIQERSADARIKYSIIYNKWTGNHCLFLESLKQRERFKRHYTRNRHQLTVCAVDKHGKISLP